MVTPAKACTVTVDLFVFPQGSCGTGLQDLQRLQGELDGQAVQAINHAAEANVLIDILTQERDRLQSQLAAAEKQHVSHLATAGEEHASQLNAAAAEAQERVAELERQVAELTAEKDALQIRLEEAEQQVASRDSALQDLTNRYTVDWSVATSSKSLVCVHMWACTCFWERAKAIFSLFLHRLLKCFFQG